MKNEPKLSYAGTPERQELWEKPIKITNMSVELDLPHRQQIKSAELSPKQIVEIDFRGLEKKDCPNVVFGRPHEGEFVPQELRDRFSEEGIKTFVMVDRGTGGRGSTTGIFQNENIPSVGTLISRFVVDPNRAPMLDQKPDNPVVPGKVLWTAGAHDEPLYKEGQEPDEEEINRLVEKLYLPYYNGMMSVIGSLADRRESKKERILVIDGHSFPTSKEFLPYYKKYGYEEKDVEVLPMFVIGDQDGKTCDQDIRDAFVAALEKNFAKLPENIQQQLKKNIKGPLVGINDPLKGVHNVKFYGQRSEGVNAIQIECHESAYTEEGAGGYYDFKYNEENIKVLNKLLEDTVRDIDPLLKSK